MNRIKLRELQRRDFANVNEIFKTPEVMKFIGPRRVLNPTEIEEWFEHELSNPSRFAVSFVGSDELIGFCGVKKIENILDFGFFY